MPTKIEWAEESWNPVTGCTKISPGCKHCYAEKMARTRLAGRFGYPPVPNHFDITYHPGKLAQPSRWKKPRRIFICSMGDLFHEKVPYYMIDDVFYNMIKAPQHTYMVLTKRPENLYKWADSTNARSIDLLENSGAWLGVTAENQEMADQRIPILLEIPAAKHFVSIEPILGPVDLYSHLPLGRVFVPGPAQEGHFKNERFKYFDRTYLDWVICGSESGPKARPMKIEWADDLLKQCQVAGVPFMFKQMLVNGKKISGPLLGGRQWLEVPPNEKN